MSLLYVSPLISCHGSLYYNKKGIKWKLQKTPILWL